MSWKAVGALILLAVVYALGWYSGALAGRLGKANAAQRLAAEQLDRIIKEQSADREDRKKLQKTLDGLPRPQGKINEAVTKHPSRCQLDPVVVDVLQDAIRKANAARALPGNS